MELEEEKEKSVKSWWSKHVDTVFVLGGILTSLLWMNGKFNDIEKDMAGLQKEIAVIKTVLIMKNICPPDIAMNKENE